MEIDQLLARMANQLHGERTVAQNVGTVVEYTCTALGADDAGILLLHRKVLEIPAVTRPPVERLQQAQIDLGQGPSVDVMVDDVPIQHVPDTATDDRWPAWTADVARAGYGSVASCRVSLPGDRIGSLTAFAAAPAAFDARDLEVLQMLADYAAIAISSTRSAADFEAAVGSRGVIGQAQGIMMERFKVDAATAFDVLVRLSQQANVKLTTIAEHVASSGEIGAPGEAGDAAIS